RFLLSGIALCGHCEGKMVGISGGNRPYYVCGNRRDRAVARCETTNRHNAGSLETALLEFLGRYDDPDKVRELLEAQDTRAESRQEQELTRVTSRLQELETGMLNDLDRLDRGIVTEAEYTKRAEVRRSEQATLGALKVELNAAVQAIRDREAQVKTVPGRVRSFLEDFKGMEITRAKAVLQSLLRSARIWNDGRVEVEFRG
ncbi:MAG: recombinase zinc beta ribbon domain-containing protein, partial [Chloroflexi bacterium]|nr:recombinase zinc beta ribbon domain-containing protein [Chloroflexota bacterium]